MHKSVDPKVPTIVYPIEFRYPELTKGKVFMSELSSYALLILIMGQNILEILSSKNSRMIIIMVGKGSLMLTYCQCDRCSSESEIRGDSYQSGGAGGLNRDSDTCYQECGGSITSEKRNR